MVQNLRIFSSLISKSLCKTSAFFLLLAALSYSQSSAQSKPVVVSLNKDTAIGSADTFAEGIDDTLPSLYCDTFLHEFTFLNKTCYASFELKGYYNKSGMRTGTWKIYEWLDKKKKVLFAKGDYLPLSKRRMIIDTLLFGNLPKQSIDSLKHQFWRQIDAGKISFPNGTWLFYCNNGKVGSVYNFDAKYVMAGFGRLADTNEIILQPFNFYSLLNGIQLTRSANGILLDSSYYKKYDEAVSYTFEVQSHTIRETNFCLFDHELCLMERRWGVHKKAKDEYVKKEAN